MTQSPCGISQPIAGAPAAFPDLSAWRVVRLASGEAARSSAAALLAGRWAQAPMCVKREGESAAYLGELELATGARAVVLKLRNRKGWAGLKRSQLLGQWLGADRLARAGVAVAAPIALMRSPAVENQPGREALLLAQLPGADLICALASDAVDEPVLQRAAREVGALVQRIAGARLRFRDMKLSNIILMECGQVGLVDTVGVKRIAPGARARLRAAERMLLAMLKEAAGTGLLPSRSRRLRCLRAALGERASKQVARASWRRLEAALARAGDTTPRVDPRPSGAAP